VPFKIGALFFKGAFQNRSVIFQRCFSKSERYFLKALFKIGALFFKGAFLALSLHHAPTEKPTSNSLLFLAPRPGQFTPGNELVPIV
jgi:hypothetical protein